VACAQRQCVAFVLKRVTLATAVVTLPDPPAFFLLDDDLDRHRTARGNTAGVFRFSLLQSLQSRGEEVVIIWFQSRVVIVVGNVRAGILVRGERRSNDVAARGHLLAHRQQEFRARVNEFLMDHDVVLLAI